MPKKVIPIKYTDRDFDSIKTSLIDHAQRYYPNTFRDFSEASFGSLMIDTVSYVGDILSFYLDYQANESFLDTAIEYNNILRMGSQLGYKSNQNPSSFGELTLYILVPANDTGTAPDMSYAPLLRRKSLFETGNGTSFMLDEDVDFAAPNNEIRVASVEQSTGIPTTYAIKSLGKAVSGRIIEEFIDVGPYQKFLRLPITQYDVSEIIEVFDNEGNEYFEVEYLSQDVVYKDVTNRNGDKYSAPAILKPFTVPRRFVVERERLDTYLQFGASSDVEVDNENVVRPNVVDPSSVVLQRQGAPYIKDSSLDPYKLIESDEFGVSPSNTTLRVQMRVNTNRDVNAAVGTVTKVIDARIDFTDEGSLSPSDLVRIRQSLEVTNEKAMTGDVNLPTGDELKRRILDFYSTQNRAVTAQDYQAMAYAMPSKFGAVKRVKIIRDPDSLKRNLNMYVMSENLNGTFTTASDTIKENLKTWLLKNKMVNDTVDILDAKIINFAVDYEAVGRLEVPKYDILTQANTALRRHFSRQADIGEPFFITDVYTVLKSVEAIVDVTNVNVTLKSGGDYSDVRFSIQENTSPDARYINIPLNCVYEVKFPNSDITGVIK
jgi:hypothetical protein